MFYDLGAVRSSDAEAQIRGHQIQTLIKVHNSKDPCELSVCIIHISAGTVVTLRFAYHPVYCDISRIVCVTKC